MRNLTKFVDIIFKLAGIIAFAIAVAFIVILFKSCNSSIESMDRSNVQFIQGIEKTNE